MSDFDAGFQTMIATLAVRDTPFHQQCEGLLNPDYFEDVGEATLVSMSTAFYGKYKAAPDAMVWSILLKDAKAKGDIRPTDWPTVLDKFKTLIKTPTLPPRSFVSDKITEFARHRATEEAIIKAADILDSGGDFSELRQIVNDALDVGAGSIDNEYDYFETYEVREEERLSVISGHTVSGITTGLPELDMLLHHRGWGRKELYMLMGAAKAGKSFGLMHFGIRACSVGYNVLHISLENSDTITGMRVDANISGIDMSDLGAKSAVVKAAIDSFKLKAGLYKIREYPTGTFRNSDLRRILKKYEGQGIYFDMIVVDYVGIMAPEMRRNDLRHESKEIAEGLRAVAQEYNVAMLTAVQTNREGAKKTVAMDTDVAEDYNLIRTADLTISINATDDEKKLGEMRLYMASSRNQEDGVALKVKRNLARARFIDGFISLV